MENKVVPFFVHWKGNWKTKHLYNVLYSNLEFSWASFCSRKTQFDCYEKIFQWGFKCCVAKGILPSSCLKLQRDTRLVWNWKEQKIAFTHSSNNLHLLCSKLTLNIITIKLTTNYKRYKKASQRCEETN